MRRYHFYDTYYFIGQGGLLYDFDTETRPITIARMIYEMKWLAHSIYRSLTNVIQLMYMIYELEECDPDDYITCQYMSTLIKGSDKHICKLLNE